VTGWHRPRWHGAWSGAIGQCLESPGCLDPQLFEPFGGLGGQRGRGLTDAGQHAGLRQEEVAIDQLRELEIGNVLHQALGLAQGLA